MENLVIDYLKKTGMPVAKSYCRNLITSHPDYPAIISVADTFETLGIDYAVGRKDEKGLNEIPFPYLIHINPFNLFMIENEEDLENQRDRLKHDWSGIIIKVDQNQTPKNEEYLKAYHKEQDEIKGNWFLGIAAALAVVFPVALSLSLIGALWMITAFAGLALGLILVRKDLGIAGSKVEEFCRSGKNSDCGEVLASSAATIWKGIKLTDLVMGYFSFQVLAVLIASLATSSAAILFGLSLISVVALPMILYSYYYQGVVTKKWCKLCLLVTAVLIAQGGLSFAFYPEITSLSFTPELFTLGYMGLSILLATGLAVFIKRKYKENYDLDLNNILAMRIAKSPTVFDTLLSKEVPVLPMDLSRNIVLGNPDASHTLYAVLNMNCDPCRKAFEKLYNMLMQEGHRLKVMVAFARGNRKTDGMTDAEYFVQYWLESVYGKKNEAARTTELLKVWFDKMEAAPFRSEYPLISGELSDEATRVISDQITWLDYNGIDRAPTLCFNNRKMPMAYRMDMLEPAMPYILEELPVPQSITAPQV